MKLHLASSTGQNLVTGYGKGYVTINHVRHEQSLIVMPQRLIEDWNPAGFAQLEATHFEVLARLQPEILLLGTGASMRFPHPSLTQALVTRQIGMEVMDPGANPAGFQSSIRRCG